MAMKRNGLRSRFLASSAVLWLPAAILASVASCAESVDTSPPCTEPLSDCSGACVDLASDPEHCGECGTTCADGQLCRAGVCGTGGAGGGGGAGGEGGAGCSADQTQ